MVRVKLGLGLRFDRNNFETAHETNDDVSLQQL